MKIKKLMLGLKLALFIILAIAAFGYLFIFPAYVANRVGEVPVVIRYFAGFLFIQFWMLTIEYTYVVAASLYGFKRKRLFRFINNPIYGKPKSIKWSGGALVIIAFFSYLLMVYGFGVMYFSIDHGCVDCFSGDQLSFVQAQYFSLITSSTVGFGDVTPGSDGVRLLVMFQIILSMIYLFVFIASSVGSAQRASKKD